jgi:hypothetical protein
MSSKILNLIDKVKMQNNILLLNNLLFIYEYMPNVKYVYEFFYKVTLLYKNNFICHLYSNGNIYLQREWHGNEKILKLSLTTLLSKWTYYPWETDNFYDQDFKNIPTIKNIFNPY